MVAVSDQTAQEVQSAAIDLCRSADADLLIIVGGLYGELDYDLCRLIEDKRQHDNVVLMLGTFGGNPDVAYKIARILQAEFKRFTAIVDTYCKSGGTLLVIGADELVMSNRGELGPLDIQIGKPDEPKERTSGLAPVQALKILQEQAAETYINLFNELSRRLTIQTKTAIAAAEGVTSALYSELYSQLEPIRLGEYQRAMSLMTDYGERLHERGKNMLPGAIEKLVAGYPDHSFVIDRTEAATLFSRVRTPNQQERKLLRLLDAVFANHIDSKPAFVHYLPGPADAKKEPDHVQPEAKANRSGPSGHPVRNARPGGRARRTGTGGKEPKLPENSDGKPHPPEAIEA